MPRYLKFSCQMLTGLTVPLLLVALALTNSCPRSHGADASNCKLEYDKAVADYSSAMREFQKVSARAATDADRQQARLAYFPKMEEYAKRFASIAEGDPHAASAADAWIWILKNAPTSPACSPALVRLAQHHVESLAVADVCERVAYLAARNLVEQAVAEDFLRSVRRRNPDKRAKAMATFALAEWSMNPPPPHIDKATGKLAWRKDSTRYCVEGEALYQEVIDRYGGEPYGRGNLKQAAEARLFEARKLQPGQLAPEIEGQDIDGKQLKLSDFRGQVVVLAFGRMGDASDGTPRERALVQRLKGRSFALVSVDSDPKAQSRERLRREPAPWRSWWDGGDTNGPIAKSWHIQEWPTVYILDSRGTIRQRGMDNLDSTIDFLMEKLDQEKQDPKSACINNLRQIEGAKEQWALERGHEKGADPVPREIDDYLVGGPPQCCSGGSYTYGKVGEAPACSLPGHALGR